jgi:cation:H+ antiporter
MARGDAHPAPGHDPPAGTGHPADGPEPEHPRWQWAALVGAFVVTVPALTMRITGAHPAPWAQALLLGLAIVGAAFLMAWAAEVIQLDISAGLALAILALIAVLPEYAVDFVFAWKAGEDPSQARFALANMTGANQILIGLGWSMVVLVAAWRVRRLASGRMRASRARRLPPASGATPNGIRLERSHSVEIAFLVLATAYGLTLPLRHTLTLIDTTVLVSIFVWYLIRISGAPAEEPHLVGPARLLGTLDDRQRRLAVIAMFVAAALVILACAEQFAEAIVHTGADLGVDEFLLVKWVAPLASEAPELIVALLFAWRLNANSALGALVSSKVNQWTLLVGTLPLVFAISAGALHGLPIDTVQREELFVTAAQSAFALAVIANLEFVVREALVLLGLFLAQFTMSWVLPHSVQSEARIAVGVVYLVLAAATIARERRDLPHLVHDGLRAPHAALVGVPESAAS